MSGAIPPLHSTPSWRGVLSLKKAQGQLLSPFIKALFNQPRWCLIKELSNKLTSNLLPNWRKLSLKCSVCCMGSLEKTAYKDLVCLSSTRGVQKEEGMWKVTDDLCVGVHACAWCMLAPWVQPSFQALILFHKKLTWRQAKYGLWAGCRHWCDSCNMTASY